MTATRLAAVVVLLVLSALPALAGEDLSVPLKVAETAGVARRAAPVTGGIPVGPLDLQDAAGLVLADAAGAAVPAQLTPMVKAEDGRLLWVLADFQADFKANEVRTYALRRAGAGGAPAAGAGVKNPVSLSQTDETVTLANGVIQLQLSKTKFNLFDSVWLDRDGDGKFTDAEKMLAPEQPDSLTAVRGKDGAAFSARAGKVHKVSVEDPGPLRTTVRVDGEFGKAEGGGESWLKYTARVTVWAGRPEVRVLYAIRNVNPELETQEQIKRAAVTVNLAPPTGMKHYLMGAGGTRLAQISIDDKDAVKGSQWHNAVRLAQVGPPEQVCSKTHRQFYNLKDFEDAGYKVLQFQPGNRKPIVEVGMACGGWLDLAGDAGGCLVWLRNFTQDTPKGLEAAADGRVSVDVIPEYAGKNQPYYADGGYWLGDRSHRTCELVFRFHAKPLAAEADWAQWRAGRNNFAPPTPATAAAVEGAVAEMHRPLLLVSTPEWYTRTGALWGPVVSLADEVAANKALGRTRDGPVRPQPAGELATEFLHYENFHYRSEWDEPRDALVEFLRTGEEHFLRRAHSFARNYRDLGVWRTDGLAFGERKRSDVKGAGAIPRWGKYCECHHYGAGLIDMWLATGDRSYLEAGLDWGREMARGEKPPSGFGDRGWGRAMAAALRAYQVTRDPALKAFLVRNCRPPVPNEALRADGRALLAGKHQSSWMTALCTHAVWHNYLQNGAALSELERDDYEDGIVGQARNIAKYWYQEKSKHAPYHLTFDDPKPGEISSPGGDAAYSASVIDSITRGYLLTGDRKLLDAAVMYWNCVNGEDRTTVSARLQDFQGMGSNDYWARQLIWELAHPRKDAEGPEAVKDLAAEAAEAAGGGKVKLTWTAPADRGGGKVARYQLKHAPVPFCSFEEYKFPEDQGKRWTWWAGHNVAGEPAPGEPGAKQTAEIAGVPAGKRHFCLVSRDDSHNESPMSNQVEVEVK